MHHGVALTDPSNYSSPFVLCYPLSSAPRRYDITGIGINLWLIHLHFIPGEPRHSRRNARTNAHISRNVHKHRQNLPSSPLLSYPESPYSPFSLETVQIRSPAQLTLPCRLPRSTCSIEIPIAALSKALYDEGSQATRALSAVLMIFHIYYHISVIRNHSLSNQDVINKDVKKKSEKTLCTL